MSLREWDGKEHWRVRASGEILRAISEDEDGETPLRAERRRNLRALSRLWKPNTIAKTECSATSFAILRRKAKRGCGQTSACKFKARRIKFKICLRSALAPNSESLILRVRPAPYEASEILSDEI